MVTVDGLGAIADAIAFPGDGDVACDMRLEPLSPRTLSRKANIRFAGRYPGLPQGHTLGGTPGAAAR